MKDRTGQAAMDGLHRITGLREGAYHLRAARTQRRGSVLRQVEIVVQHQNLVP